MLEVASSRASLPQAHRERRAKPSALLRHPLCPACIHVVPVPVWLPGRFLPTAPGSLQDRVGPSHTGPGPNRAVHSPLTWSLLVTGSPVAPLSAFAICAFYNHVSLIKTH